jgi:hypothetical protein
VVSFEQVRAIALALPEVEESTTNGSPAFRVRGRLFLHLWDDGDTLVIRVGREEKRPLLDADPDRFFVNRPHTNSPAVLTRLSAQADADVPELADLIEDAWRRCAPAALSRTLPAGGPPPDRGSGGT